MQKLFSTSLLPAPKEAGVYGIVNNSNRKIYVGSSVKMRKRLSEHKHELTKGVHHSKHLQRSFYKNPHDFEFVVIENIKDLETLIKREQFWIQFFNSHLREHGYNVSPSAESCRGLVKSPEERLKMSLRLKGRKLSPEAKSNVIAAIRLRKRKPWTQEMRFRVGLSRRALGLKRDKETTRKWLELRKRIKWGYRSVVQMDMAGNDIARHESMRAAIRAIGAPNVGNIHVVCKGRRHSAFGFKWRYA